ncbi:hypothetical protein SUGI_0443020 [Cryptomeria japonica]|uniref:anthocyanin regulatory R-S protein-like n=1 Tax=Cryptomeria japonica TaxID=3369 RepID=UPI002408D3BF|nr:anthocyanin regulatory R-S protein-like [Cryptomeria japonica]GLJ23410.1 hypothetical protein SUGI_0443020 [Cryptomeria japonica]
MDNYDFRGIESFLEMSNDAYSELPQHSAFNAYVQQLHSNTNTVAESSQTLHKKCFRFLRKIDEDRKLAEIQRSLRVDAENRNQAKTAFHHLITERNRRARLNEHFQNLHSLLPRNCKKDRISILSNATSYLRELKLRVCELEQQNESTHDDSTTRNFSNSGEGSGGFESQQKSFISESPLLYRSDDVVLERCKDFPSCHVKIMIDVQRIRVSCPPTLLLKVIALLSSEQLEILSLSHEKGFGFQAIFLVLPKGEDWNISHWQTLGDLISQTLN